MPDIEEVFEDMGDNAKRLFKNKKFWLVALGVAAVALFVGWRKGGTSEEEEEEYTGPYEAIGYAGYPTVSGGGGDSADYVYEAELDALYSNVNDLSDRLISTEETITEQNRKLQEQIDKSQMQANSELYNAITDRATKDALHALNLELAEKHGWEFDKETGNYFDDYGPVYTTTKQQVETLTGKTGSETTVKYVTNAQEQRNTVDSITSRLGIKAAESDDGRTILQIGTSGKNFISVPSDKANVYANMIATAQKQGKNISSSNFSGEAYGVTPTLDEYKQMGYTSADYATKIRGTSSSPSTTSSKSTQSSTSTTLPKPSPKYVTTSSNKNSDGSTTYTQKNTQTGDTRNVTVGGISSKGQSVLDKLKKK